MPLQPYLAASAQIDFDHPEVALEARILAEAGPADPDALIRRIYEWVRDQIHHSWDYRQNPVTCRASDVLRYKTGYCYAKSHLLAALLRANGIPTGFCYQRLTVGDDGAPYCLHGLNAVWRHGHGWYRIDARGNKPGIAAEYCPPVEKLAFAIRPPAERDLPEIWAEPLPAIVEVLTRFSDVADVHAHLPDVELIGCHP